MPTKVQYTIPANLPEEMLDQPAPPKALKFFPRFVYLLERLTVTLKEAGLIEEGNRAETFRFVLKEFAEAPHEPLPWLQYRPRYARPGRRVEPEERVRKTKYVKPLADLDVEPIDLLPIKPYLTYRYARDLDLWAEKYKSTWTYLLYQAIWDAAIRHGIQPADEPVNLRAPEGWAPPGRAQS